MNSIPPKVSKVSSSKTTQTKTIAKASTSSSSKSSGSSKTSSSSGTKKSAPPVTSKPKNVDKVDFGKPKSTVSAGTYKPAPPPKTKTVNVIEHGKVVPKQVPIAPKKMEPGVSYPTGTFFKREIVYQASPEEIAKAKQPKPKQADFDPKPHSPEEVDAMLKSAHEANVQFSQSAPGRFIGGQIVGKTASMSGIPGAGLAAKAYCATTESGKSLASKVVEKILDFGTQDPRIYDDDMELF
ncbi:MAG: hypothetical protein IJC97_00180 [Oscillospiraceae bacterium]|nr:hypothetical protein [Oscillospiraceae bacterium]